MGTEGLNELWTWTVPGDDETIRYSRGDNYLEYEDGRLVITGIEFPSPRRGDVLRWDRGGSLLINGVVQHRLHPLPRRLEQPGTHLKWDHGRPSQADTLSVSWTRTGRLLAVATDDGFVRVWDVDRAEVKARLFHEPHRAGVNATWGVRTAISPDGKTVASSYMDAPDVILWDVANGNKTVTLSTPAGKVRDLRFLSDDWLLEFRGERLLARRLTGDRSRVIDLGKLHPSTHTLYAITISGDGKTLALFDGTKATTHRVEIKPDGLRLIPVATVGKQFSEPTMALSQDGGLLAVYDGTKRPNRVLAVYDAMTGTRKYWLLWRKSSGFSNEVGSMCFLADGKMLAVGGTDVVRFYDLDSRAERAWITTPWVRGLASSGDGQSLAAGFRYNASLRFWDIAELQRPNGNKQP